MSNDEGRLVREALAIAELVARRMSFKLGGLLGPEELLASARPVLLEAVRAHDPDRTPFEPYIVQRVKWAMLDEARRARRSRRVAACAALERLAEDAAEGEDARRPLPADADHQAELSRFLAQRAAAMVVGLASMPPAERSMDERDTPEDRLAREELSRHVRRAIERLPERQRALVERHYFGDEKFEAIAADLGVSKSWASRLHAQAMDALASALRDRV